MHIELTTLRTRLSDITGIELPVIPCIGSMGYAESSSQTQRIETQRRHALEVCAKTLAAVQDLEVRLDTTCWVRGGEKWVATATMLSKRRYQRALDQLEALVISRMFELTKVNMSDTGKSLGCNIGVKISDAL